MSLTNSDNNSIEKATNISYTIVQCIYITNEGKLSKFEINEQLLFGHIYKWGVGSANYSQLIDLEYPKYWQARVRFISDCGRIC